MSAPHLRRGALLSLVAMGAVALGACGRSHGDDHAAAGGVRLSVAQLGFIFGFDRDARDAQSAQQCRDILRPLFGDSRFLNEALSIR